MGNAELQNKLQEWNNAFSSLMDKAPELIPYLVSETPEQLMRVLREETFPVEHL